MSTGAQDITDLLVRTVLIVEDEPDLAGLLRDVLMEVGFDVVLSTGTAAVATATRVRPHAIVMDYLMPGLTGEQVVRELREAEYDLPPIILVTGRDDVAEIARRLDVQGYLRKPFDVDELVDIVRELTRFE